MQFSFVVPGEPKGKARARTFYDYKHGITVSKTPEGTALYENLVKMCWQRASGNYRFQDGAQLHIGIQAYYGIPKRTPKKYLPFMLSGLIRPVKTPDVDNIAKIVLDALNKLAYKDDSSIVLLTVEKFYSDKPLVKVTIGEMEVPQNE